MEVVACINLIEIDQIDLGLDRLRKNMVMITKCSMKCLDQFLFLISEIYFHNLLHICLSRFVVLFNYLFDKCNIAHFLI